MLWSIALIVLFAVAMSYIIVIAKKMNKIIDLLENKTTDNKNEKE